YHAAEDHRAELRSEPLPVEVAGHLEYHAEKIVNDRVWRRKQQYLVHWEGYGIEGRTWENKSNVEETEAYDKYLAVHPKHKPIAGV
ncbi:hypothetical protein LPJ66_010537, partial [Kickxella alabastrina]